MSWIRYDGDAARQSAFWHQLTDGERYAFLALVHFASAKPRGFVKKQPLPILAKNCLCDETNLESVISKALAARDALTGEPDPKIIEHESQWQIVDYEKFNPPREEDPDEKSERNRHNYEARKASQRKSARSAHFSTESTPTITDTITCSIVSGENGASACAGQPDCNGQVPWEQRKAAEDVILVRAVNTWNDYAAKFKADGVPTVSLKSILTGKRRIPTVTRLKEIEGEGYTFEDVLTGLSSSPYYRGKGNDRWVADFDWLIGPDTKWQRMAEKASLSQEPEAAIPIRDITDTINPKRLVGAINGRPSA